MTDTWDNEGGAVSNTPQERYIKEMETTVEGLGQQNTELERQAKSLLHRLEAALGRVESRDKLVELKDQEIDQHKTRYKAALVMIERRQSQLVLERGARQRLALQHAELKSKIENLLFSVLSLKDVPASELDCAVFDVAKALDSALKPS